MDDYEFIKTERLDTAMIARLDNPPRNLLNAKMVVELSALVNAAEADEAVRTLILTGASEGTFILHYDVGELSTASDLAREQAPPPPATGEGELHGMHKLLLSIQEMSKPVIAAINGTAMGGGCELALACDFRYIAKGGIIGLPEVRVGILPGAGGTQRMARLLGTAKALELMLLGQVIDADEAERIGLVHKAVEPDQLLPAVLELAGELADRPPLSLALIKRCILKGTELPLIDALRLEQDAFLETMRSDDASRLMRGYQEEDVPLNER
ncbi:MAG: enoyl-CoA hydratase/isomerase family protein [Chloroflexi bacterium]|nr:enoyl-CoA hydratase/isomerase family protein [Chloroflexota bacterium]